MKCHFRGRIVLLALLLTAGAYSQTTDAVVSGTVVDPGGAVVPQASVFAENTRTGVVSSGKTNAAGVYLFAALQPGAYRIRVEHQGFQTFIYEDLVLEVGAQVTVNASLKLGTT